MPGAGPELLEQARQLLQLLIKYHLEAEHQYIWYILVSIPLGIIVFMILTRGEQAAHLRSLGQKMWFFFSPFAPETFLVVLDSYGWHVGYDAQVIPGKKYYVIRFKGKEYRILDDPWKWAVPSSLLDMKGPVGVPSPFGLVTRLILAWMLILVVSAYAFTQTAYISYFAYHINPTWIDVVATLWFAVILAWFLRNALELHRSTGMVLEIWSIPPTNIVIPVTAGTRTLKEWKDLLLRSTSSARIEKCKALEKLAEKLEGIEDEEAAAQLVAMARDAVIWRQRYAELEEQLDRHVEAAEAAALRAGQPGAGLRIWRWMPLLIIVSIVLAVAAVILALQPSVEFVNTTSSTVPYTAAQPPSLHTVVPSVTPAKPPPPPS